MKYTNFTFKNASLMIFGFIEDKPKQATEKYRRV